jgi:hypothetical protein
VDASEFDEAGLFAAVEKSGVRALLIGRGALVVLGVPVVTADYDFWMPGEDIERLNAAVEPLDLYPNHPPDDARKRARYVLENGKRVDVLIAQRMSGKDGDVAMFEDVWQRRLTKRYDEHTHVVLPSLDDLIRTKRWSLRPKDVLDIQMLEALRAQEQERDP